MLTDVLISIAVISLMTIVMATTMVVMLRSSSETSQRLAESNDVQFFADALAQDVNGLVEVTEDDCGTTAGLTPLFGILNGDDSRIVYYADLAVGTVQRRTCDQDGSNVTSRTLVRDLASQLPDVLCDGGPCSDGTIPEEIQLVVTEESGFSYALLGSRRHDPGGPSWNNMFYILGSGSTVVTASGGSSLTIHPETNIATTASDWFSGPPANLHMNGGLSQGPFADPLAAVPAPSVGSLPVYTDGKYHGPGVYRNELKFDGPTTMASGVYILEKGITISGHAIVGNEVLIYTGCATGSLPGCENKAKFTISGSGSFNATPQKTGSHAGILIFHARGNTEDLTLSGSAAGASMNGLIYARDANKFTMGSGGSTLSIGGIVTKKVVTSGGGVIEIGQP